MRREHAIYSDRVWMQPLLHSYTIMNDRHYTTDYCLAVYEEGGAVHYIKTEISPNNHAHGVVMEVVESYQNE